MDIKSNHNNCETCKNNKRLCDCVSTNSEMTAAWQDTRLKSKVEQVNIPDEERVIEAKEWVDKGSKL